MIPASIWKQAEQNPQPKKENFSKLVNELMMEKMWRASDLARKSSLSKSTVSHILSDTGILNSGDAGIFFYDRC